MIFYTADLHLGYFPILHDTARPFTGVPEMDEALISNWNARVGADDSVYIVGDFSYNGGEAPTQYLSRLNGHLHLIRGNHDTGLNHAERLLDYCDSVTDFLEIDDGVIEVLATAGNNRLGGDDFDQRVINWMVEEFKKTEGIDLSTDKMAVQRLKDAAEKAKIELSSTTTTNINIPFITADATGAKHLDMNLTVAKFNELTKDLVDATMGPVQQALSDSGLSPSDLNKILMVGGSSRIPAVQEAVRQKLGKEPFKGINPDECVALGAAYQGGVLGGDVKDGLLLLDVTPLSLGLETMGGVCTKIIERNTTIPTKKSQIFSTAADNQSAVDINVLQGEREFAKDNKQLGTFRLDGIAPAPRGIPQIEVTFDIDQNGIVHVTAKDLGTGKEQDIKITASTNMSKDDIDKAVKEAEQYAEEDKKRREEVDSKNNAESLCFQCENALKEFGDKVPADEKSAIESKIADLRSAVGSNDAAAIKAKTDDLQQAFYALSSKMYQQNGGQPGADPNMGGAGFGGADPNMGGNPNGGANDDGVVDADFKEV